MMHTLLIDFTLYVCVYFQQNVKRQGPREGKCHTKTMMSTKANEKLKSTLIMCRLVEHGGKRTREGAKSGVGRRERMKRGRGMNGRDDRSRGT